MRIVMFYHSLVSDWNHGNAHFLRGVVSELLSRGHDVRVFEPSNSWSAKNLLAEHGRSPIARFHDAYPGLDSIRYDVKKLDVDEALDGADMVIVHEWNDHDLVRRVGEHREQARSYRLFFHDTHHRSVTDSRSMSTYDISNYDGVLAFGNVIRDLYLTKGWARLAWTWHEAADTRVFHPIDNIESAGDLVWVGNWGDDERTEELHEFLLQPVKALGLRAQAYGVRYPKHSRSALQDAGIRYRGWLPNFEAPRVFAGFKATVHVPRRPYARALPGIPTIRVFEALACGISLVSSPWDDVEDLFSPGADFLVARNGDEMRQHLQALVTDSEMAREISSHGRRTILERHTCRHRVDELLAIHGEFGTTPKSEVPTASGLMVQNQAGV